MLSTQTNSIYDVDFQMMASTLIHATILGVFMLHSTAAQSCSTPFQAAFTGQLEKQGTGNGTGTG